MGKLLIINASPRAPKSNSKGYSEMVMASYGQPVEYCNLSKANHGELGEKMAQADRVLLTFPLYADGIPVTLLNLFKSLEGNPPARKPQVSVLINCGFIEYEQNDVAVEMVRLFCKQNGYAFGSVLRIGGGEAILGTPFKFLVARQVKKLCAAMEKGEMASFHVTMPMTKGMYLKASTKYWTEYGKRNGITEAQMRSMEIE